jgi:hypothetical protein
MPRTQSKRPSRRNAPVRRGGSRRVIDASADYLDVSRKPLQILAFLLPLIIAYELALSFVLESQANVRTVLAHRYLVQFFDAFNIAPQGGLHLGGVAVVVVLLTWHVLNRDPWNVNVKALGIMAIESLILALPLLVLGQLIQKAAAANLAFAVTNQPLDEMSLWSKVAISIGAGLYEELMFRMLLIAVLHTLLVDVMKASHHLGAAIAIIVSAALFTWYHPLGYSVQRLAFFFIAGVYFGSVYVTRGFGIVVGTHALYDIITFTLGSSSSPG